MSYTVNPDFFRFVSIHQPDDKLTPPMRAFFRRLGASHVLEEVILPTLGDGTTLVTMAIHDRPWPPWGIGAQAISALTFAHPIGDESAGLTNIFMAPEEHASLGLIAAVHKHSLDQLKERGVKSVHFVVREAARLASRITEMAGFKPSSSVFLTETGRYWLHEADIDHHLAALGLKGMSIPELLEWKFGGETCDRMALFHHTVSISMGLHWAELSKVAEIIANTGIARVAECAPPGGPPPGGRPQIGQPVV